MAPIKGSLLVLGIGLSVLLTQPARAEALFGLGAGGVGLSGDGENLSDSGAGGSVRLGYLRENDRLSFDYIAGQGFLSSILDVGMAYRHYTLSYDYLAKNDSGVFQVFLGPHIGLVSAESCYLELPGGSRIDKECGKDNGFSVGAQAGVILQASEVLGLELGYRHSFAFGLETRVADTSDTALKDTVKQISYGYFGLNLSF